MLVNFQHFVSNQSHYLRVIFIHQSTHSIQNELGQVVNVRLDGAEDRHRRLQNTTSTIATFEIFVWSPHVKSHFDSQWNTSRKHRMRTLR